MFLHIQASIELNISSQMGGGGRLGDQGEIEHLGFEGDYGIV